MSMKSKNKKKEIRHKINLIINTIDMKFNKKFPATALLVLMAVFFSNAQEYVWQKPQATVTETGAVLWKEC